MMGELGTYASARVRTVDDCGRSSARPNGSIMPEAFERWVCDAGMLNTGGMLFILTNTTKRPHIITHVTVHTHTLHTQMPVLCICTH